MAKRRSKEQISSDRIIKRNLLEFGDKILEVAVPTSRRDTGRLQDEMNFRVNRDTQIEFAQMYYGAYNYPSGVTSGEKNALRIAIDENIDEVKNIIISEIKDVLLSGFKK